MIYRFFHITDSFIDYECIPQGIFVHSVFVSPERRNKGIGTKMVTEFLNKYPQQNIYIFSSGKFVLDDQILEQWYESFGFTKVQKKKQLKEIPYKYTHQLIRNKKLNHG